MSKEGKDSHNRNKCHQVFTYHWIRRWSGNGVQKKKKNNKNEKKKEEKRKKEKGFFWFQSIPLYLFCLVSIINILLFLIFFQNSEEGWGRNIVSPSLWKGIPQAPVSCAYWYLINCIFFTFHEEVGFTLGFKVKCELM